MFPTCVRTRIRGNRADQLGVVEADDANAAIKVASKTFEITDQHEQSRIANSVAHERLREFNRIHGVVRMKCSRLPSIKTVSLRPDPPRSPTQADMHPADPPSAGFPFSHELMRPTPLAQCHLAIARIGISAALFPSPRSRHDLSYYGLPVQPKGRAFFVAARLCLSCSNSTQAALSTPDALAAWVAIASISAGERQS